MLKAGVHFGHQSSHWHPKMAPYIYTIRNGVHIIDLKKTTTQLQVALDFLTATVAAGGDVLFVGTKTQAQPLVEKYAQLCEMPYIRGRWIGGVLTNFSIIKLVIKKYLTMTKDKQSGEWGKYTKKEQVELNKELARLESNVAGLKTMDKLPKALFVVDVRTEKTAIHEANNKEIPVVGVCDTNVNPSCIDYVIPANDDATRGIELMLQLASEAVMKGLKQRALVAPKAAPKTAPKKEIVKAVEKTVAVAPKAEEKKAAPKKRAPRKTTAKKAAAPKAEATK